MVVLKLLNTLGFTLFICKENLIIFPVPLTGYVTVLLMKALFTMGSKQFLGGVANSVDVV